MTQPSRVFVSPRELIGIEIDGRYRIHSIVGGGGMGVVFRTLQTNLGRDVALKLLRIDENKTDHRLERFLREIDIISQFTHPNIVRIYDSGRDRHLGLFYIAMELIDGLPLDRLLSRHRARPEFALEVAYQILAGLTEPHAAGIIHRDIKPGNLLLKPMSDDSLQVKVVDFGIARAVNPSDEKITTTGVVVGTPAYMAPELAIAGEVDERSDLYSVGVLIYELLSGERPFTGDTPVAILLRHAVESPPSLSTVMEDFAYPEIAELVDRLLTKEPEGRPRNAKEVRAQIDAIRSRYGFEPVTIDYDPNPFVALAKWLTPRAESTGEVPTHISEENTDPFGATSTWTTLDESEIDTSDTGGWLVSQDALARVPRFDPETGEMLSVPHQGAPDTLIDPKTEDPAGDEVATEAGTGSDSASDGSASDGSSSESSEQTRNGAGGANQRHEPPVTNRDPRADDSPGAMGAKGSWIAIIAAVVAVIGLAAWGGMTVLGGVAGGDDGQTKADAGSAAEAVVDDAGEVLGTATQDSGRTDDVGAIEFGLEELDAGEASSDETVAEPAPKQGSESGPGPTKTARKPVEEPKTPPKETPPAETTPDAVPGSDWINKK